MSADVGCLGWRVGSSDTILKGDHLRTIPSKFGPNMPSSFRGEDFKKKIPIGSYVKTMSADFGCLGWQVGSSDTILKVDHLRTFPSKFGPNRPSSFRGEYFKNIFLIGSYVKTMSVEVGGLGWRMGSSDTILKGDHLRNILA